MSKFDPKFNRPPAEILKFYRTITVCPRSPCTARTTQYMPSYAARYVLTPQSQKRSLAQKLAIKIHSCLRLASSLTGGLQISNPIKFHPSGGELAIEILKKKSRPELATKILNLAAKFRPNAAGLISLLTAKC